MLSSRRRRKGLCENKQPFMPSKCPMQCAIASFNSLDLALRAHLHSGSMTIAEMAKIRPDPQVQGKYANLTKSLQQQIHKRQRSDEGDRRYARKLWDGLRGKARQRFLDRYEAEGRKLGNWLCLPNVEIGGQEALVQGPG